MNPDNDFKNLVKKNIKLIGKDKKYSSLTEMISKEKFTENGYYIIGTSVFEVVDGVPRIKG